MCFHFVHGRYGQRGQQLRGEKGYDDIVPLCIILMELSAQLQKRKLALGLNWRRRDRNIEADALTNEDFSAFQHQRRIEVNLK